MLKIRLLCASVMAAGALVASADELSETGEFLDGVAAVVNEGIVLKSEFDKQIATIRERANAQRIPLPAESILNDQVLENLIVTEIQFQRAERYGITEYVNDQLVNEEIGRIAAQQGVAFEDWPAFLAERGINYTEQREEVREQLILRELEGAEVVNNIEVSDREIEQCILDLETNVVVNSDWQLSHILLAIPENATSEELAEVQALADDIHARLQDNADFRELAARYSTGSTALQGGALGWLAGQQVPSIFTDVLQTMKAGDVSEPFRTASSIHIVKVDDLRSALERSEIEQHKIRHILVSPDQIIDDATAKQQLTEARDKILAGDDFGELAKLLSDDTGSANEGGDLGWSVISGFAPEFAQTAANAEIGVISEPFRTRFGWHILEVLDRRVYDNTEEMKERNCDYRIRAGKLEDERRRWLQRLRDEAFVDKRI